MTKHTQPAFSTGEIAPDLTSSTELEKQAYGLAECSNMIVDALGGVKNRPGTQYIADCYDATKLSRLVPFQFNTEQSYMLEFSDSKMRILKDGGLVGAPTEVVTVYPIADVPSLGFTQSADILYIFHSSYEPKLLTRTSDTAWNFTGTVLYHLYPFKPSATGDDNIRINAKYVSMVGGIPYGELWDLTASSAIFGDIEVQDTIRIGFPVPGDTTAIHWVDMAVDTVTSTTVLRVKYYLLQNYVPLAYEQVAGRNKTEPSAIGTFPHGIDSWENLSTGAIGASTLTYDEANEVAVLTDGAAGDAIMMQSVLTFSQKPQLLRVKLFSLTGATPQVRVSVGTTALGVDIMAATAITTTTEASYTILPTAELIYITIDTNGSTDGDILKVERVSLTSAGEQVTGNIEHNTSDWRLPAWNLTDGYPSKGIIHEQRLYTANSPAEPQTIWAATLGVLNIVNNKFYTPALTTDAFQFNPPTVDVNGIEWLLLQNGLKVGTAGGIWKVYAASGGALTPTDVNIQIDNAVGSLDLPPITIGNSIIMTPRGYEAVSELTSSFETSGYVPKDISALAAHLFEDRRIISWTYARNPDSIIWCVLDNGELLGLTYRAEYGIWAWHKHTTPLGEGFKDVSSIPNSFDDNIDDVYFVINRAELGETPNYYIEQLNKRITPQTAAFGLSASGTAYDYKFLDSALTWDVPKTITGATKANPVVITSTAHGFSNGDTVRIQNVVGMTELNNVVYTVANQAANTFELSGIDGTTYTTYLEGGEAREMETAISGLDHLEGETVTALADGRVEEGLVVTSGAVTLAIAASFVHIGLPYTSQGETVDIEAVFDTGSTQGKIKSLTKLDAYFKDTRGADFAAGSDPTVWWPAPFESEAFGETPPPLFNGVKELAVPGKHAKIETVKFRQTKPLPFHLKRLVSDVKHSG